MMFAYEYDRLNNFFKTVLQRHLSPESWTWLAKEGASAGANDRKKFNIAFVAMPRKTGKALINISADESAALVNARKGLHIEGWTTERLARVWLLMQVDPAEKSNYVATIENLFLNAEMSELVALYSSLPVLAYPDAWRNRCAEGIRSNIGQVLEAVICNNPYPSEQLDEPAWNQLVLKAIFTEKPVLEIVGLKERRNSNLARSLSDYAHERWAARREVNPLLWICVIPFIDSNIFSDIQRVFQSENPVERDAAALAAYESQFEPARKMVEEDEELRRRLQTGELNWASVAERMGAEG
jgi:hypothetical protein